MLLKSKIASLLCLLTTVSAQAGAEYTIKFDSPLEYQQWYSLTDRVMGGLSTSRLKQNDNHAIFSGVVSLENNGGFAMVTRPSGYLNLDNAQAISLVVRGDGKQYQLRLGLSEYPGGVAYTVNFTPEADQWSTHYFDSSDFVPMYRGQILNRPRLSSLKRVKQVGFMIGDKQTGDFQLDIATLSMSASNSL